MEEPAHWARAELLGQQMSAGPQPAAPRTPTHRSRCPGPCCRSELRGHKTVLWRGGPTSMKASRTTGQWLCARPRCAQMRGPLAAICVSGAGDAFTPLLPRHEDVRVLPPCSARQPLLTPFNLCAQGPCVPPGSVEPSRNFSLSLGNNPTKAGAVWLGRSQTPSA